MKTNFKSDRFIGRDASNLGAQSHVAVSFENPECTADVDGMGALRISKAIRNMGPQKEPAFTRPARANSVAWCRKPLSAKPRRCIPAATMPWPSPMRTGSPLTIAVPTTACMPATVSCSDMRARAVVKPLVLAKSPWPGQHISQGMEDCLYVGSIDDLRGWRHAVNDVRLQWLMLQQDQPDDFVIDTGVQCTLRQFINWTAEALGMQLRWRGSGVDLIGC